jgi:hypothetical protein
MEDSDVDVIAAIAVLEEEAEVEVPTFGDLEEWMYQGGCEAVCEYGCWVEPDGHCEHGKPSWLLHLGLI